MTPATARRAARPDAARVLLRWLSGWWRIVVFTAQVLVLALSPGSYGAANRPWMARHLYLDTAPLLPWFTVLSALISLILIRIVLVSAMSYGLSQYALEMLVRVLVLELIPLTAAVFVALRCAMPNGAEIAALRARGEFDALRLAGVDPLQRAVLPRVAAGVFATLLLAAVASVVTLVLAYLSVYGFTAGGFGQYTHTVGRVFSPSVALIFVLKTFFLSVAVAVLPIASVLYDLPRLRARTSAELAGLVRLFLVIVLIEAVSLVGNYS